MVPATGSYLRAVGWESWRLFATFSTLFFFIIIISIIIIIFFPFLSE